MAESGRLKSPAVIVSMRPHAPTMVSVGRIGTLECDFVARRAFGDYFYIQVAMTIADRATEDREYRPFEKIRDSYPRCLLILDPLLQRRDGALCSFSCHSANCLPRSRLLSLGRQCLMASQRDDGSWR